MYFKYIVIFLFYIAMVYCDFFIKIKKITVLNAN